MGSRLLKLRARPLLVIGAMVSLSFLLRLLLVWGKQEPLLLPDEYIYAELSRGLFDGTTVRETSLTFYALLEPLITYPFWNWLEPQAAYRAVQTLHSLLFALAALPAYALARRVGAGEGQALAVAALSLLIPDLAYAGFTSTEAVAYPLFITWVWVTVTLLATPSRRLELAFLGLSGLAASARMQMIVLPLAYLLALAALALWSREKKALLRQQALAAGALVLGGLVALLVGSSSLGGYAGVVDFADQPVDLLAWMGRDLYVLMWNSGLVLLPGCLIAVAYALWRPLKVEQRAFALLFIPLLGAFLVEGAYYASKPETAQLAGVYSRYFFYLCPLIFVGFVLYARYARPAASALAALSLTAIAAVNYLPLSGLAIASSAQSPLLQGIRKLDKVFGGDFRSRPYLFLSATVLFLVLFLLASRRPRLMPSVALTVAAVLLVACSLGTTLTINSYSKALSTHAFGASGHGWVQEAAPGSAIMVPRLSERGDVELLSYWQPSLRPTLLPGSTGADDFSYDQSTLADDGTLLVAGKPLIGTVIFLTDSALVEVRNGHPAESIPMAALWRVDSPLRLSLLVDGYFTRHGELADKGTIQLWPERGRLAGYLELRLERRPGDARLRLQTPARTSAVALATVAPLLRLPVCSDGAWSLKFRVTGEDFFEGATLSEGRRISAHAEPPRFVADPDACP